MLTAWQVEVNRLLVEPRTNWDGDEAFTAARVVAPGSPSREPVSRPRSVPQTRRPKHQHDASTPAKTNSTVTTTSSNTTNSSTTTTTSKSPPHDPHREPNSSPRPPRSASRPGAS